MTRAILLAALIALAALSCREETTGPSLLEGTYTLVDENGAPLPADSWGCCITLSGSITFTASTYDLHTSQQSKNSGSIISNSEQGSYIRQGNTITFTRTGGGGLNFPYLLAPGTVSADGATVVLLYGDEGPGSNQVRATFRR